MSDYTANRIMIKGSQGELAFARHVLHDMDFNKILPCPETLMVEHNIIISHNADLAFLYTIYGDDPVKAIQNGKNPQMINVIYPTWQKNLVNLRGFKESIMADFPENTVINPDAGHPFGQESSDISYLWGKGHEDTAVCHDGADFIFSGGEITLVSDDGAGNSKKPRSCADLAALGRIRYINHLKYGYTDWYEWRETNWGVKWNADYLNVETGDGFVSYDFCTPWNIPYGIFREVEKLLSPTSLEVIWEFAFERKGSDCGYFMKKADEKEFVYTDKEGDVEFAGKFWG